MLQLTTVPDFQKTISAQKKLSNRLDTPQLHGFGKELQAF